MPKLALWSVLVLVPSCGPSQNRAAEAPAPITTIAPPLASSAEADGPPPPAPSASPEPSATIAPEPALPGIAWVTVDSGVTAPDDWRTCASADDCTLVRASCCDPCNGGKAVAVTVGHRADAEAKYAQKCPGVTCTMRGCFTRASCESGRCVMQWGKLQR